MKKLSLISSAVLLTAPSLFATTVAQWTFETTSASITGSSATLSGIAAETGSGTASGVHASSASTWSSPTGNGSSHSFSVNTWGVGDYWQFQLSTVGFTGLSLSYDQTGSNTGPGHYQLSYSLDGTTYTALGSQYSILANAAPNTPWSATTPNSAYTLNYDLGSLVDNSSTVFFRITDVDTVSANGGTVAAAGTDRIDNFTVFTTPVPEPTLAALFGLGGLVHLLRRKIKA